MDAALLDPGDYDGTYKFVGGRLCLDLVNTISWPSLDRRHDWLDRYPNLIAWAEQARLIDAAGRRRLLRIGAEEPRSEAVLAAVHQQRAVLAEVVAPLASGERPRVETVERLNALLGAAAARLRIAALTLEWVWEPVRQPEDITAAAIYDAAELLAEGDHTRVGLCASCQWLYYDTTRNRSRRWCDMADCGSREKARTYYRRHHRAAPHQVT